MDEEVIELEFLPRGVLTRNQCKYPMAFQAALWERLMSPRKRRKSSQLLFYSPQSQSPLRIIKASSVLGAGFSKLNGDSPARPGKCKCKQSGCLKLYCMCFESGKYCDGCSCCDCKNTSENEDARQAALVSILERHKSMEKFTVRNPKFSVYEKGGGKENLIVVNPVGCYCKKSHCIQGYCVCYQANMLCSEICNCINCRNDKSCNAIPPNGPTKSRDKENIIDLTVDDQPSSTCEQSWKTLRQTTSRSLNFSHRSFVADSVKLQNLTEFCKLHLVTPDTEMTDRANTFDLETVDQEHKVQRAFASMDDPVSEPGVDLSRIQVNTQSQHRILDGCIPKERPVSAKTVPLTRNQKDLVLTLAALELIHLSDCFSEDYVEQEKLILMKFQEFLTHQFLFPINAKDFCS